VDGLPQVPTGKANGAQAQSQHHVKSLPVQKFSGLLPKAAFFHVSFPFCRSWVLWDGLTLRQKTWPPPCKQYGQRRWKLFTRPGNFPKTENPPSRRVPARFVQKGSCTFGQNQLQYL
jgi:hypothetical protein